MILKPDLFIVKNFILAYPISYFFFSIIMIIGLVKYLSLIFKQVTFRISRSLCILAISFCFGGMLLVPIIILIFIALYLLGKEKKTNYAIVHITTVGMLLLITVGWVLYIKYHISFNSASDLTVIEIIRKLYKYPSIYNKVLNKPIEFGLIHEYLIALIGMALYYIIKCKGKSIVGLDYCFIFLLVGITLTGIAKSFYNHPRYYYYTYPILIIFTSYFAISLWNSSSKIATYRVLTAICVCLYVFYQLDTSYNMIIEELPGNRRNYTTNRLYLDHRTCCQYYNEISKDQDYVLSFSRTHELSVYCEGLIDACIRPRSGDSVLDEYVGDETHNISGAKFIDSKDELETILHNDIAKNSSVWIFKTNMYVREGYWESYLLKSLSGNIVCVADDKQNYLIKISSERLKEILHEL